MMSIVRKAGLLIAATALVVCTGMNANAQEGHPLKGSWIGEWKGNKAGDFLFLVLDWDGKNVTGTINPGQDDMKIKTAVLNPADWSVHIEADGKVDGKPVTYQLDGKIQNLELPSRSIVGTWKSQAGNGALEVVRQ